MENTSMNTPKKNKKKINDFVWTFVGIAALIIVLMLLRLLMQRMHLVG